MTLLNYKKIARMRAYWYEFSQPSCLGEECVELPVWQSALALALEREPDELQSLLEA
jgi:hypothetical protein